MTTDAPSQLRQPGGRWLFGPIPDLFLGCGLLYVVVFAGFAVAGPELRALQPLFLVPLLLLVVSSPHYGATLLRVYEHRADRRRYAIFSVWATGAVAIAFIASVYSPLVGSAMLTVYLTWSPWHYTGQNFGLAMLFLRRRGVAVSERGRRLLYASFLFSYLMLFVSLHQVLVPETTPALASEFLEGAVVFKPLGLPATLGAQLFVALGIAYVFTSVGAAWVFSRRASIRDLAPAALLMLTQALWFSIPIAISYLGLRTGAEPLDASNKIALYVQLTAFAHAAQYLWVTSYFARGSEGWRGYPNYLGKTLVVGTAIWALPVILFGPDGPGGLPYGGGLALLVASAVNIHHFILDGAIWKLRSSRVANVLIRSVPADGGLDAAAPATGWSRRLVWGTALVGCASAFLVFWQSEVSFPAARAREDYHAAVAALDRLAWLGRDSAERRRELAEYAAWRGGLDEALRQARRSLQLAPSAESYQTLASILEQRGQLSEAEQARSRAEELLAASVPAAFRRPAYPSP